MIEKTSSWLGMGFFGSSWGWDFAGSGDQAHQNAAWGSGGAGSGQLPPFSSSCTSVVAFIPGITPHVICPVFI